MPHKANEARRHKIPKARHKVANRPEHDRALQQRGSLTVWVTPEALAVESFNGKLRDELLDAEAFNTLAEAEVLIERWRRHYNTARPHSSLGYSPPAPDVTMPDAPTPPGRPGPTGSAQPLAAVLH